MKNVHIVPFGREIGHIFPGIQRYGCHKMYLITSEDFRDNIEEIEKRCSEIGIDIEVKSDNYNPFTKSSLIDLITMIVSIVVKERDITVSRNVDFYINTTGGTGLMAVAAATAAYITKSTGYYILDDKTKTEDRVLELGYMDIITNTEKLPKYQKKIVIQLFRFKGHSRKQRKLSKDLEISPQLLSHHIKELEKLGFVKKVKLRTKGKGNEIILSDMGKFLAQLL